MSETLRAAAVPAYIFLCILLGGSVQGAYFNLTLQLIGLALIAWAWIEGGHLRVAGPARGLVGIAALSLALLLVQLIPLPPALWSSLPGREPVAEGYGLLGMSLPWLPISLTPYETGATVLTLVPPFAVLSAMLLLNPQRPAWIAAAVLAAAAAAVLLGAFQVGSANPLTSRWYLYDHSNFGTATGFFANSNHMAALLVICIPLLAALIRLVRDRATGRKAGSGTLMIGVAGVLVLTVGIILNRSLAVLLLLPPVAAASATMLLGKGHRLRRLLPLAGGAAALILLAVFLSPLGDRLARAEGGGISSRQEMWSTSLSAVAEHAPLGTGIGSFRWVYPAHEDPGSVDPTITNHAHNDYLEIAVEAGIPGLLLLILFLVWWVRRAGAVWRTRGADPLAVSATIISGALLLHSFVDYPLRTAALVTIMAACVAMMARPSSARTGDVEDLWPTRHLSV